MENDSNVFHVINNLTFNNSANIGNGVRKLFRSLLNFNLYILVMIRLIFLTKFLSKSILIFVQLINVSKFVCIISTNWHPSRRENRHHRFKQFIIQIIGPKLIHKLSSLFLFYRSQYPIKVQTFCRIISRRNLTTNLSSPTWPPSAYLHSRSRKYNDPRDPRVRYVLQGT